jgi:hypothetical protein
MEQPFIDIDEIYNQKLGEVLNFFMSKLQIYYSSSRLTLLLTFLDTPSCLCPITGFRPDIIPLSPRLKLMDSDALWLRTFFFIYDRVGLRRSIWKTFRDFLDSGHPLALDEQKHATAASACLKIIFKHYQVPLPRFQRRSRRFLTPKLSVGTEHLSHRRRNIDPPGWKNFLETYFSIRTRPKTMGIYFALDRLQRVRANHCQLMLEKSAYSDNLLNFARRRVFRFGYLHRNHPTYMKKAFFALAKYIQRVTGETAEVRACESIWGRDGWFTAQ